MTDQARSPMSARQKIRVAAAALMTALTVALSVHGLAVIASRGEAATMDIGSWTVPLGHLAFIGCLDGMALVAALSSRPTKVDITILVSAHGTSAVLQFIAAPDHAWAKVVHTGPVLMTGVALGVLIHDLVKLSATEQPAQPRSSKVSRSARTAAGATSPKPAAPPAQAEVSASGTPRTPGAPAEAGRKGEGRSVPSAPPPPTGRHLTPVPDPMSDADVELARQISDWLYGHSMALSERGIKARIGEAHEELFQTRPGGPRSARILKLVELYRLAQTAHTTQESRG